MQNPCIIYLIISFTPVLITHFKKVSLTKSIAILVISFQKHSRVNSQSISEKWSVQSFSYFWLFATHGQQHTCPPCSSPTPEFTQTHVHWVSDAIQPSIPLSSLCPAALNLSQHHQMSQFFGSAGQGVGVSASALVLPMNIWDWFPLGWTDLISLLSSSV